MKPRLIVCVCKGNTCRSPMFVGILQQILNQRGVTNMLEIESAGLMDRVDAPASELAQVCMRERRIDISAHRSRRVRDLDLVTVTEFLCVEPSGREALRDLGVPSDRIRVLNEAGGGIPNPYGQDLAAYQHCADILKLWAEVIAEQLAPSM